MGDAKFLLSWVSSVTSVCVQLVGVQICFRIVRKGNPGDLSNVPFISLFVAACVWLRYGLLTHVTAVVFVNGTAAFLQFCYMTVYYTYSVQRSSLYKQYLFACVALFSVLAYVKFYAPDEATAVTYLGLIGCLFTVFGYGAPLATLKHVLRTKSTDSMSLLMCSANLLVATEWLLYGYLLKDAYIALPNVFGIGLAFLQLYLFIKFPSRRSASKPIVA